MTNFKKLSSIILSLVAILLLSACTSPDDRDAISGDNSETEMLTEAEDAKMIASTQGIESLEPVLTLDKALAFFYSTFEKEAINFESIQFKKDSNGNYRYFIEGWDEKYNYALEIDVGTAEIIEQEMRVHVEIGDTLDLEAAITPKQAMDTALEGMDDEAVEEWELKVDQNNRMIYKIAFLSGQIQKVDALSGKVQ